MTLSEAKQSVWVQSYYAPFIVNETIYKKCQGCFKIKESYKYKIGNKKCNKCNKFA